MTQVPTFFVPAATPETQEGIYAEFARWCGRALPSPEERVYSITFIHDGEEWTATVGQTMTGTRQVSRRVRGQKVQQTETRSDPARVLAIFPGDPFMVVTNHRIAGNVGSRWENPFFAGRPVSVTPFSR